MKRHMTQEVNIGSVSIGAEHPVAIQTMWDRPIEDTSSVLRSIEDLAEIGCDLMRFSILDTAALAPFSEICRHSSMPIIADIHFDHTLRSAPSSGGQRRYASIPVTSGPGGRSMRSSGPQKITGPRSGSVSTAVRCRCSIERPLIMWEACSLSSPPISTCSNDRTSPPW